MVELDLANWSNSPNLNANQLKDTTDQTHFNASPEQTNQTATTSNTNNTPTTVTSAATTAVSTSQPQKKESKSKSWFPSVVSRPSSAVASPSITQTSSDAAQGDLLGDLKDGDSMAAASLTSQQPSPLQNIQQLQQSADNKSSKSIIGDLLQKPKTGTEQQEQQQQPKSSRRTTSLLNLFMSNSQGMKHTLFEKIVKN